jgi:DNA-directed RNA polymerase specialized sigma subunit
MTLKEEFDKLVEKAAANPDEQKATTRQKELQLWQKWKDSNEHPDHLEPLLESLQPLIRTQVRKFEGRVPIQKAAIEADVTRNVITGLRKFDPGRGAQLSTWLTSHVRGAKRFITSNQNFARITAERADRIGDYDRAISSLSDQLSRPPTAHEIADHMKRSVKMVNLIAQEKRSDLVASRFLEDPFLNETPRAREVLELLEFELSPKEMQVFEYLTGRNGKPKTTSTSKIARTLGWSDSKVSQVKNSISKKIHQHTFE